MDDVLLYFVYKYLGNWEQVYSAISDKESVDENEINKLKEKNKNNFLTITSENYPNELKDIYKPPFLMFYDGNKKLLDNSKKFTLVEKRIKNKHIDELKKFNDPVFVVDFDNAELIEKLIDNKFKLIVLSRCGLNKQNNINLYNKILKSDNLLLSEMPSNSNEKQYDIYFKRALLGLSKKMIFFKKITIDNKDFLRLAAIDGLSILSCEENDAFGYKLIKVPSVNWIGCTYTKH